MERADLHAVGEAAARIRGRVHVTPVMHSATLDALLGCRVSFKVGAAHTRTRARLTRLERL